MKELSVNDKPASLVRRGARLVLVLAALVVMIVAGWTWLTLSWSYSVGERAGVLQKFSRKGWICKTYEGEVAQYVVSGVAPQIWYFSVRDEAVAQQLFKVVGQNMQLRYREHRGTPTNCFGDTPYFAESFTIIPAATR
jgi:hypothetical protein